MYRPISIDVCSINARLTVWLQQKSSQSLLEDYCSVWPSS